eukprot:COSAG04_NODE_175_length_21521_cov_167.404071_21_plen_44_part_00
MIYLEKDEKGRIHVRSFETSSNAFHTFVSPIDRCASLIQLNSI